jgi:hypothetical protein
VTAKLYLERAPGGWADSLRAYEVIVNEEKRAELRPGEKTTIEVDSGKVDVYLRLDSGRSRSITLNLEPGSEVRLFCQPRSALTALYRATLGRNNYMRLEVQQG